MANKIFEQLCIANGLPKPTPEYQFHAARKWRIDYYFECDSVRVALEVEGGVHVGGRHTRGTGFEADIEKYNELAAHGILLVRCQPKQLTTMATVEILRRVLFRNNLNK